MAIELANRKDAATTTIDYGARCDRLTKEIEKLVSALYNTSDDDDRLRCENLKTYRVEVMRSFILYMHLANRRPAARFAVRFHQKAE
jgi:hypothetical protein